MDKVGTQRIGRVLFIIAGYFLFVPALIVNAASLEVIGNCAITLKGEIDKFTDVDLVARYKSLSNGNPEQCKRVDLLLYSNGGDAEAAIRAGDFVRHEKIRTGVPVNASCSSACVLLLVGGVERMILGKIGLHRPFSSKYSDSEIDSKNSYEKINRLIRQYLNRMNIPERLLNVMNSVPPGDIKWLTNKDDYNLLSDLHITGSDPVFADQRDSLKAKQLGISKQEYYLREQKAGTLCGNVSSIEEFKKCNDDVMNGRR